MTASCLRWKLYAVLREIYSQFGPAFIILHFILNLSILCYITTLLSAKDFSLKIITNVSELHQPRQLPVDRDDAIICPVRPLPLT